MFASAAVRTCRVTMLIHPTAAFFCVCVETGTSARVVHDGSDAAVWLAASQRERERKKKRAGK